MLPPAGEVPYPLYWSGGEGEFNQFIPVAPESLAALQSLLDATHRKIWTRDRAKHNADPNVPQRFRVTRAVRSENSKNWREYSMRRALLLRDYAAAGPDGFTQFRDVKCAASWIACAGGMADCLAPEINEWYLFHGTNPAAAESICTNDFKISLAGGNTGTLYGRGAYLAESVTKADEYAKPNAAGEYAVLLNRALGGHPLYSDELEPDPEELVQACVYGPYDCVIGDREKVRGTFREFVFFDTENIYAEYIIYYVRDM